MKIRFAVDRSERLDVFLTRKLVDQSRTKISEWIHAGKMLVDGKVRKPSFKLELGMVVELESIPESLQHDLTPADIPLEIVYEDEYLLVVNKPRGLATHPARSLKEPSLVNALLARSGTLSAGTASYRPGIVHRLDKDTTGLLLIAKQDKVHRKLADMIQRREITRAYIAYVWGHFDEKKYIIEAPIARDPKNRLRMAVVLDGKPAITYVQVLREIGAGSLIEVKLGTGRTHQIRVHLSSTGHPVRGDKLYSKADWAEGSMRLHAHQLEFVHPVSGKEVKLEVEPPVDFWTGIEL